ncbi:GroES-like protein [Exidia glandulosa HHB12029]|uniref:GroES-like protein n=1 Tax=Exidia glandulosa HHB12029 TaxID=1314781 RepID=A0A165I052_EXIGL|nr:GroES-like protein [Exidia glandulosa HHB12029]
MPRAVVLLGDSKVEVRDVAKPTPESGEILVKVHAAGLNPTDWKHALTKNEKFFGAVSGCDFAGVVEAIGPDVPAGLRTVGERVAGIVHGSNVLRPSVGAFAEYLVVPATLVFTVPESVSLEVAAAQGVAAITTAQMLWQSQSLPTPDAPGDKTAFFLVWSGATGVGQWLIQLAHQSGLRVVTTASLKHTERLKALGAEVVFDYRDPEVAKKIREYTGGKLTSGGICEIKAEDIDTPVAALSDEGGILSVINFLPAKEYPKPVKFPLSLAYHIFGKAIASPVTTAALPHVYEASVGYYKLISRLLAEGKVELVPVRVFGGLESVSDGFAEMREGRVSGERIVFKIL